MLSAQRPHGGRVVRHWDGRAPARMLDRSRGEWVWRPSRSSAAYRDARSAMDLGPGAGLRWRGVGREHLDRGAGPARA